MTLAEFFNAVGLREILSGGGIVIVVIFTFLQIAPIKINPWSWLAKKIGHAFMKDLYDKIDRLEKSVQGLESKTEEQKADERRSRILLFGDEILHDVLHSKERFDQILLDITFYEHYCATHSDYSNNVALMTIATIKATYKKCMEENSFL